MTGKKYFLIFTATLLVFILGLTFSYFLFRPGETGSATHFGSPQTKGTSTAVVKEQKTQKEGTLVTRAVDGDTIEIEGGQRVRYIGVDTPETVHPSVKTECYGTNASAKNRELVEGQYVRLEKDISETDKYGRLLRYVYVGDLFVNDYLVRQGYAHASSYPPDIKYQDQLTDAQKEARQNNRGLWSSCENEFNVPSSSQIDKCNIKGNISSSGEKIYHMPGQKYYDKTVIDESKGEKYFCQEEEAQKAGFRISKT